MRTLPRLLFKHETCVLLSGTLNMRRVLLSGTLNMRRVIDFQFVMAPRDFFLQK